MSNFGNVVYQVTRMIPEGKVATYGQIARMAGSPKAARAVGMLMKNNPDAPRIPCHRVVGVDGSLVGYSGGIGLPTKKKRLLGEGVKFKGIKVDLESCLWTGDDDLSHS